MGWFLLLLVALEAFGWYALRYSPAAINMIVGVGVPLVLFGVPWLWWTVNDAIDSWYWNRPRRQSGP